MADIKIALENIAKQQRNTFRVKQRRKRQRRLVTEIFLDYADHSTLHGLRYIAERGVATFQKIFWLLTFLASLIVCGYYISNVYVKWRTSPVIVSLDEKLVCVGDVPFPSVTICPQIKSRATVYSVYENSCNRRKPEFDRLNSPENLQDVFEDIATLCHTDPKYNFKYASNFTTSAINYPNATKKIYYKVSPSPKKTIVQCTWHGSYNCNFMRVLTAEGVCFNFNSLSARELFRSSSKLAVNVAANHHTQTRGWNSETGYNDSEEYPFPLRGDVNGADPDLELLLVANDKDRDLFCNNELTGYKIYLHNPLDLPQSSLYFYAALDNQVTSLAVDVNVMRTSESLIHYRPEVRQCYFPHEKYLKFFKIYTDKNCRIECLTNKTLSICGCVGLYMPHYDASTRICKRQDRACMKQAHIEMVHREGIIDWNIPDNEDNITCRCLPSCNNIEYDAEVLKTTFNTTLLVLNNENKGFCLDEKRAVQFDNVKTTMPDIKNLPELKYSKLSVYFKKPLVPSMRRSELFGWTDFVANVGGLLGLFLGFSVLSLIEILYFLTVKICVALKRDNDDNKCVQNKRKKAKLLNNNMKN